MYSKDIKDLLKEVSKAQEKAKDAIKAATLAFELAEKWDRKYINDLPNAAFAVVESGYKEGGNKNARHLP